MIFHVNLKIQFLITFSPYGAMTVLEWFGFLGTGKPFLPEHWGVNLRKHILITFSSYGAMTVLEWFGFLDTGEPFQPEHWGK